MEDRTSNDRMGMAKETESKQRKASVVDLEFARQCLSRVALGTNHRVAR